MKLVPVDPKNKAHVRFLWRLLRTRLAVSRISHDGKTTWKQHQAFVANHPYHDWCLVEVAKTGHWWNWPRYPRFAGAAFISMPAKPSVVGDELHVELLPKHQGRGLAEKALLALMKKHPRKRYVANVAPGNLGSYSLFNKMGFRLCQYTLERIIDEYTPERVK
jgi:GNAT superfamily N-acetyltransferase